MPRSQDVDLSVPAHAAYSEPDPDGIRIGNRRGATRWSDPRQRLVWYGFTNGGPLDVRVAVRLPDGESGILRAQVGGKRRDAAVPAAGPDGVRVVDFGRFDVRPGAVRIEIEGRSKSGATFGDVDSLHLGGPAAVAARFQSKERRNAASVHLGYPLAPGEVVTAVVNEATPRTDPIWSFHMACGWHRGYFGIQVNSPTERRIIFSVWDSGNEAVDRSKVAADDRVRLLAKGGNVVAEDFGNEGTGGHSHLVHPWRTGATHRFLVTAEPEGTGQIYTGWFYFPERKGWGLIARFFAPRDGGGMRGLHVFNENFHGPNGQLRRECDFGPAWIRRADGTWRSPSEVRFTHDPTGKQDRLDYGAEPVGPGKFRLWNGGFDREATLKLGDRLRGPATPGAPPTLDLPPIR